MPIQAEVAKLLPMTGHIHIPKTGHLQNAVQLIWQSTGQSSIHQERIVPKGVVEIIFYFGESSTINATLNNRHQQLSRCFINGYNTSPIDLQFHGIHTFFGVQFHPLSIRNIIGIPLREFANRIIDLTLADATFDSLWHQLAEKESFQERIAVISTWAEKNIVSLHPQEQLLNGFLTGAYTEAATVPQLATALCYSPRHLSRKISDLTEMNTESFLSYKRFLYSVQLMHNTSLSLTAVAHQSGFTDQSHFIKSFRSLTSMTPGEYRQNKSHLPGHLYNVR